MVTMRTQTLVQLTDDLLALLDERAEAEGRSRSALIREAIEHYLAADLAARRDRAIVDGYRRIPPPEPYELQRSAAIASIEAEPW
jgi:predicted transcriptional regulator